MSFIVYYDILISLYQNLAYQNQAEGFQLSPFLMWQKSLDAHRPGLSQVPAQSILSALLAT